MKRVFVIILTLIMMVAMVGCGNSAAPENTGAAGDTGSASGDDTVYEVTFSSQEAEASIHSKIVMELWANKIEEATNGRVKFVYYWSNAISGVPELLDNLESGAVDAAWASTSAYAGRYTATKGITLPGLGLVSGAEGSEAIWKWLHEELPTQERGSLVLAGAYTTGDLVINNKKKELKTAEDFHGLRLRPQNSAWQAVFEAMDVVPVTFNVPDSYESLEKNIADGLVLDFSFFSWARIYEVSKYFLDESESINIGFMYWSPQFLDKLPDDLREIVLSFSGLELSRAAGEMIVSSDEELRKQVVDNGGVIYPATDEVKKLLKDSYPAGVKDWIKECDARDGYKGQEIYDKLIEVAGPYFGK